MVISTNTGETLQVSKLPSYDATGGIFFARGVSWDRQSKKWDTDNRLYSFTDYQLSPKFYMEGNN